jgi:acyl-CoA thioesterase-2|tara:strand:+ start:3194 stop:4135 length:942 start_codon:yes stop_codon:yes gene_type:complete
MSLTQQLGSLGVQNMGQDRAQRAAQLLKLLELKQIEENLYQGQNEPENGKRLFGGQVLAQAAMAAFRTVTGVQAHSLHAYFLRAGRSDLPVLYEVERVRDGRSFTTRRVVAIQNGRAIFNLDASFHLEEIGLDHSCAMPNVPKPDELLPDTDVARAVTNAEARRHLSPIAKTHRPFETRSVFPLGSDDWLQNRFWNPTWLRFPLAVQDEPNAAHRAQGIARSLLCYASDMGMVSTVYLPHQSQVTRADLQMASLDHAIWIHRPVQINEWLLFHKRTSTAQGARGMGHAEFFSESGELVASVTQEGLVRTREIS